MTEILLWAGYFAVFAFLVHKGRSKDAVLSGSVGFGVQAFAYVATYISAVALVGFGGLAHAYGLQMLLVAAGNVWFGTWAVYRFLAWPTRKWQERLGARTPAQLLGLGHGSPSLTRAMAFVFALFLGVYGSAVIKGAALLLAEILPVPVWALIWLVAIIVGLTVFIGGLRGVLYTEAMQGVVMLVGMLMLVGAIFSKVGGPWEGMQALAALPPSDLANNGFVSLSGGERGLFILSLVVVTSIAVWAQPQMMQRHFAIADPRQLKKTTPLAMFILTVLVGGAYFAAALSRLILPEVASPDQVMPKLVQMLLPEFALHIFVLAIVSASPPASTISRFPPCPRTCAGGPATGFRGSPASPSACSSAAAAPRSRGSSSPCSAPPAGASSAQWRWCPTSPSCASDAATPGQHGPAPRAGSSPASPGT